MNLGLLSDVAVLLNDAERAAVLYELLLPAAACNAVDVPEIFTGAVARNLGVLAALMGRWADAEHHFEAALELNERFGAPPWVAQTQLGFAHAAGPRRARRPRVPSSCCAGRVRASSSSAWWGWARRSAEAIEHAPAAEPRR